MKKNEDSSNKKDYDDQEELTEGNVHTMYRQRRLLNEFAHDLLIVLSGDHIYKLDYRDVIDIHNER